MNCGVYDMKNKMKLTSLLSLMLALALCVGGCGLVAPPAAQEEPGNGSVAAKTAAPATAPAQTQAQPVEATWVIEIDDTQRITDEMGLIWNYTLTLHASKPGGTDVAGDYEGEAVLTIEPDFESARQLAAREGTMLLSMLFSFHAECESLSFEVIPFSQDEYAARMKKANPDNPLAGLSTGEGTDFFAIASAAFTATQEPVTMTIEDDGEIRTGTGPGSTMEVAVPTELSTDGAKVYCFFYDTPHPLACAFQGTVTGDVLP
jgi:hypothetical protein